MNENDFEYWDHNDPSDYDDSEFLWEEDTARAEMIVQRQKRKSCLHWAEISLAIAYIHDYISEELSLDESVDHHKSIRSSEYRSILENKFSNKYPGLVALIKNPQTFRDLFRIFVHYEKIQEWFECQPSVQTQLQDTNPSAICSLFLKLDGKNWTPTQDQKAARWEKEESEAQRDYEEAEKLQRAEDVFSFHPPRNSESDH